MDTLPAPSLSVTQECPAARFRRACRSRNLSRRAQMVGQAISHRMNAQGFSRSLSHAVLGEDTNYKRRSVSYAIRELCEAGLLRQILPETRGRGWLPRYEVIHSPAAALIATKEACTPKTRYVHFLPYRPYLVLRRTLEGARARAKNPNPGMFSPRVAPLLLESEEPCPAPPGWFDEIRARIGRRVAVA